MTFGYGVMIKSNIGKRPSWIWQIWWPQGAPASAPSKNKIRIFFSTSTDTGRDIIGLDLDL